MPTFETNGGTLYYEDVGHGPPLVLLHGFPLSSDMWQPQRTALQADFRVITPDLRGMGRSGVPVIGYSMDVYAADVAALLNHLQLERVLLGGMSMGGYVVFAFLRRYRERVRGLILIDTQAAPDNEETRAKRSALIDKVRSEGAAAIADTSKMFSEDTQRTNPELVAQMTSIMQATAVDGIVGALTAMIERPDATAVLQETDVPALVVVGREDPLTPPDEAHAMQAALPHAELLVLDGAAHAANLEQPDIVNQAIRAWAAKIE